LIEHSLFNFINSPFDATDRGSEELLWR